jgi:hypothetical protein
VGFKILRMVLVALGVSSGNILTADISGDWMREGRVSMLKSKNGGRKLSLGADFASILSLAGWPILICVGPTPEDHRKSVPNAPGCIIAPLPLSQHGPKRYF